MIKDAEHILAYHDPEHACNQGSIVSLDVTVQVPG